MIRIKTAIYLFIGLLSCSAGAASFDCARAASFVEKAICADSKLSGLDDALASAYKDTAANAADPGNLKTSQLAWLKTRNACPDFACLTTAYQRRIKFLDTYVEKFSGVLVNGGGIDNMSLSIKLENGRTLSGYCGKFCTDWFTVDKDEVSSLRRKYVGKLVRATVVRQRNRGRVAGPGEDEVLPFMTEFGFLGK